MNSRGIMMGYLFNPEKTLEAIDPQGWLHSGDLGVLDPNGVFRVTGRLKDIIITAGGENVAPIPIEEAIKRELPCVSNAMLIGDQKKFISCLLTMKVDIDAETMEPKLELTQQCQNWCFELTGTEVKTVTELISNKDIQKAIQDGIKRVNAGAVSNAQKVQKWTILPTDFSLPGDELGPTLKLKRQYVVDKYAQYINSMYSC